MLVEVDNCHIGTLFCIDNRDGAADAAVAAGDQSDFAAQLAASLILSIRGLWSRPHLGLKARPPILMLRRLILFLRCTLWHDSLLRFFNYTTYAMGFGAAS